MGLELLGPLHAFICEPCHWSWLGTQPHDSASRRWNWKVVNCRFIPSWKLKNENKLRAESYLLYGVGLRGRPVIVVTRSFLHLSCKPLSTTLQVRWECVLELKVSNLKYQFQPIRWNLFSVLGDHWWVCGGYFYLTGRVEFENVRTRFMLLPQNDSWQRVKKIRRN